MLGCELNILDYEGTVDLSHATARDLILRLPVSMIPVTKAEPSARTLQPIWAP